jgi:hypothetical protein
MSHGKFYKMPVCLADRADLNGTDKLLLAIIMDRIGKNGHCWPGERSLGSDAGVDRRTARQSIKRLENAGCLLIKKSGIGKRSYYSLPSASGDESPPLTGDDKVPVTKGRSGRNTPTGGDVMVPEAGTKHPLNQTDPLTRPTLESNPSSLTAQEIVAHWNAQVNLPRVQKLTPGRRKKLETRLRDPDFAANCLAVIEQINRTPFLTGDNDRGWKASLDWLAGNEDNWVKVSEGRYDDNRPSGTGQSPTFSIFDHPEFLRDPNDDPQLMADLFANT